MSNNPVGLKIFDLKHTTLVFFVFPLILKAKCTLYNNFTFNIFLMIRFDIPISLKNDPFDVTSQSNNIVPIKIEIFLQSSFMLLFAKQKILNNRIFKRVINEMKI